MMRNLLPLVLTIALASACEVGRQAPASPPRPTSEATIGTSAAAAAEPAAGVKDAPGLEVLDTGKEPRVALRYEPTLGSKQTFLVSQKASLAELGGNPRSAPSTRLRLEIACKDKLANGAYHYEFSVIDASMITEPGTAPATVDAIQAAMATLKGTSGVLVANHRGQVSDVKVQPSKTMNPRLAPVVADLGEQWMQLLVVLPDAPVGVGAKWEHRSKSKQSGIEVDQRLHYELVGLVDKEAKLELELTQTAKQQDVERPLGAKRKLESFFAKGTGEATVDLTQIAPTASEVEFTAEMSLATPGRPKQDVRMVFTRTVSSE